MSESQSKRKAVFSADFHWTRPSNETTKETSFGFSATASEDVQTFPADFVEAAIKAGKATAPTK